MATTRYSTSVSLCEDTSKNFELFDLLKQADPTYSAVDPARIKLYVYDGTKYVEATSGYFTAVDKDTFTVDASLLPNFNGELKVRVLGTDSTGNSFILDITIDVTPVNDAPSGADDSANVASGDVYVLGLDDFGFTDPVEGDAFKSVVITTLPSAGTLLLNGVAVTAGQEVLASDVAAGSLTYLAPSDAGGAIGFTFQVRDTGGTDGCGGNDLDLTPNTFTFNVPVPAKAVIGDTVWEDVNGNGLQDTGEAGIGGITVQLRDPQGNLVQTTTTDNAGKYSFTVNPGSYFVTVMAPNGYAVTEPDVGGNDAIDSDVDGTGLSSLVTVAAGDINNTVDAGLYRTAQIGNRVWLDVNGNGLQDAGEAGVQGVQVRLLDANGNAVDGPIATDANGDYLFSGLKPGIYSLAFDPVTLPAGYSFTTRDAGSDSADSDVNPLDGSTIQTELVSGESDLSWDAGIVANPGSISGSVTEDQDNDDSGDAPIAGVTVQLKDSTGTVVQTTTTDANGNYTFNNVPAGTYTVVETNKPGFSDVGDVDGGDPNVIAVTLTPGATSTGNDFVDERLPGVVSGTVLEDNDNDNVGDTPIPGVTVELKDPAGNVVQTTTTDANGNYTFNNVPAGNYTVVETNKPGYTDVGDSDGGNPNTIAVTVTPGSSSTGNVFVDERPATLGDRVWEDTNANGVQDAGEAGIANVTVQLKDTSGNVVQSATTDANGNYSFSVTPGTYTVAVLKPAGYEITGQDLGGNEVTDSDINAAGVTAPVTLQSGQNNPNVDAGLYRNAELGDKVWYDTNKNGAQDAGEAGVQGVKVSLLDAAGNVVTTQTTDASGNYLFTNLKPGTYSVQFDKATLPMGYVFTSKDAAADGVDSDADTATGKTIQTVLDSGESDKTWDAGIVANPGSISGTVREDLDNNNSGDTPIAGVTVQLKDSTGTVVQTTTTDANGNYTFNNVPAGTYTVVETNKPGFSDVGDVDGGDPNVIAVTLTPGATSTGNDFVDERLPGVVSGTVLEDNDNDNVGDTPIPGVTVELKDPAGNVVQTTTTDANGNYTFNNVPAGNYTVVETNKPGYTDVGDSDGGNPNTIAVTVTPGSSSTGNVFVDERPATLGDRVWEDKNANGVQDAGEAGIANVTVQLKDTSGNVVQSATTDANGNYSFSVTPGTYTVAVLKPAGYEITGQDLGGNEVTDSDINAAGVTAPVTLQSGQNNPNVDAGLYRNAELGDKVWYDTNKNGAQDAGEAGVQGVKVSLLDAAGNVVTTQTTDASGNYLFTNLKPGTYSVQFDKATLPTGYVFTSKDAAADGVDSDADTATGKTIQTVLDSGESDKTWDAGIVANPGSISGTVREDLDNNNSGDTPIAGVTVQLKDSTGTVVQTTTTDANGNYTFNNVPAGTYTVVETNKPGFSDVGDVDGGDPNVIAVTLTPGATSTGNDFVDERLPGVVSGTVLEDNDNDNVGDTPIPGVTVELKDPAGNVVQTTTTDANGNYTFNNVPAGNYTVVETNKPGYTDVGDSDGGNPNTIAVTVTPGSSSTGNVFVDERPATLGDRVWEDTNANGVQDAGEAGIANVTVQLKDTSGNVVQSATTDANGNYSFSVTPGTYTVAVLKPAGYEITGQDLGGNEVTDSDINAAGVTAPVTLQSGQNNPNVDAGLYRNAELGDKVWYDTNKNGAQDAGEAGVQGVKVSLLDAAGNVVTTQTTDASGNYLFTNLKPGTYSVQFDKATLPTGYVFTSKDAAADGVDSDADTATGKTIQTVLDSGESDKTWDAGIVANPGSISGTVREDLDNNNSGDTPIAGVTVQLKDSTGTVVQTTTTDANGNYTFNNVPAGTYTVVETNKPGYLDVGDTDGGNPNSIAVTLTPGASSTGNDFVDERTAAIGDKVWLDKNANGVQDAGEAGIAGVAVKLLDSTGTVVGSSTTDANGNYQFSNLTPGDYAVQITAPTGYFASPKDQGGNDATDSDIDPTTGKTINTTLSAGETDLTWDAGLYQKASLGDKVWLDTNKNGVQDTGEAGVSGVTVKLLDSNGNEVATATTDANGNYLFKDLVPGNYSVQVVAPAGTSFTGKDLGGNDTTDSDVDATGKSGVINLESGETDASVDAGLTQATASYGDKVWLDKNANGVQDAGEAGIAGVTVKLLNTAGAVVATTTTDANGNYLFNNLTPGDYSAQIVAPTGYFLSAKDQGGNDATDSDFDPTTGKTIVTTLATGESDLSWDAGLYQKASIGDKVWADCDNDGIQDANEAGVVGVTVKLLNSAGTVVATTMTDANGNYLFKDLVPGSYSVQVVAPTGYTITAKDQGTNDAVDSDADQATGKTVTTVLESGENDLTWDAGLAAKVATATFDFNGNMATDGTDGNLLCFSNNGITVNASAFSRDKSTGTWAKAYLGAYGGGLGVTDSAEGSGYGSTHTVDNNGTRDNYVLFEFNQAVVVDKAYLGYVVGDSDAKVWIGTVNGAFDSHITLSDAVLSSMGFTEVNATTLTTARWAELNANGFVGNVLIVAAAPGETNDYFKIQNLVVNTPSAFCATDVSIGDKVWEDTNANGRQDAGEAGIAGVTVKLLNSAGTVLTTTTTDSTGAYLFSGLPAGSYKVQVVTPNGYVVTTKDASVATDATDSDIDASGISGLYTLTGGSNNLTVDAGFYKARASLGDKVWCDADKDGIQDAGEVGATGVTVKLLDANGTVVATTTTDANGNYKFSNLNPGDYSVQVVAPTGYVFSAKDQGTNDAVDSDVDTTTGKSALVTLSAGENDLSLDAGIYVPAVVKGSIGDKVWQDMNYNGIQDTGEAGISGVTVKLLNSAGTVVATTVTNTSGNYLFSNLNAGDYKVQVVTPTGYYVTKQDQAGWNGTDSAFNASGYTGTISLAAGQSILKADAGLYRKASIGDKVWADWDHDDVQDAGEGVVKNVKVMLQNASGTTIATTYTDVNGNYKFTNLDPGTYRIAFDKTSGIHTSDGASVRYWSWADPNIGTNDSVDSDGVAATYTSVAYTAYTTLVSGEADMTWDAGITPIVLDLDGNGIQTIARENSGGKFDLLGTGAGIDSGWISAGDAFLAVDIDGDGKVTSVAELFGGYSKGDGFAKLENFDSNGDGYVDAKDAAFADLRVWQDLNGNHQTDDGELRSLSEAGVASLKVAFTELPAIDEQGNLHLERSSATLADGSSIDMTDVYFNVSVADAEAAGIELPSLSALLGDDRSLDAALGSSTVITVEVTATTATVTNCVSDGAVTAMSQLANLYDEQQLALMAA